jgi:quinol monooxygenase YgiN
MERGEYKMITIVAKSKIKEGKVEEYIALAKELVNESRKEAGCVSYYLNQDLDNKNVLTFIEEWENKEAIEFHNNSAHFTRIFPKLLALKEKASEVNKYERV